MGCGVKGADTFDVHVKKFYPVGPLIAVTEDVYNSSPDGKLPRLVDKFYSLKPIHHQYFYEGIDVEGCIFFDVYFFLVQKFGIYGFFKNGFGVRDDDLVAATGGMDFVDGFCPLQDVVFIGFFVLQRPFKGVGKEVDVFVFEDGLQGIKHVSGFFLVRGYVEVCAVFGVEGSREGKAIQCSHHSLCQDSDGGVPGCEVV